MITKRYTQLLDAKEKLIERINDAKQRGDPVGVRLEENELRPILCDIDEENFNMTGNFELE